MQRNKTLLAGCSGLLFLLSFPPFPFGFLSPFALCLLLHLALTSGRREAFLYGLVSGVVFNTGLLYWIPRLMESGLYVVLVIGMALLIGYLSAWVGLAAFLVRIARERSAALALALFPFVWTAQEKARELSEMSFPWVTAGYTFGDYLPLIQFLSVGGVYCFSFLIGGTASLLYAAWLNRKRLRAAALRLAVIVAVYGALALYGGLRMARPQKGEPVRIAMVQANVDQRVKWVPSFTDSVVTLQKNLAIRAAQDKPDLIVWSESALPFYFLQRIRYRLAVQSLIDSLNIPLIFGSLDYRNNDSRTKPYDFYNSVFYYRPEEALFRKYDKIRLVPFSEMLPFEGLFPIISRVDLGEADFSSGDSLTLFDFRGKRLFTPICYEVVYPGFIRSFVRKGGGLMVHLTNDGWFGRSGMPFQHANITRFRAVENGIPVAQCANTGVSCFIDPFGRISPRTRIFTCAVLTSEINAAPVPTFYTRHGDWTGWLCIAITLLYFIFNAYGKKRRNHTLSEKA